MMEDADLILAARAGDQEALSKLLIARQTKLYKTAYLYVHTQADALDVVQETSLRALLSIGKLRQPQYFDTWLIRILINVAQKVYRQQTNTIPFVPEITGDSTLTDLHADLMSDLAMIPENFRVVLILFYFNDLEVEEIARVLRIPAGTVRSRLTRGRKMLRERGAVYREYRLER